MPTDTPLHKACNNGELTKVRALVEDDGIDVNAAGASERRPIHRAAGGNHADVVTYLIETGASVDQQDRQGRTALHWAAISGHTDVASILFDRSADPMLKNSSDELPMHCAAEANRATFVGALIATFPDKKEAMFTAKNEDGKTPAELAREGKSSAAFNALKDGGDPGAQSAACVLS